VGYPLTWTTSSTWDTNTLTTGISPSAFSNSNNRLLFANQCHLLFSSVPNIRTSTISLFPGEWFHYVTGASYLGPRSTEFFSFDVTPATRTLRTDVEYQMHEAFAQIWWHAHTWNPEGYLNWPASLFQYHFSTQGKSSVNTERLSPVTVNQLPFHHMKKVAMVSRSDAKGRNLNQLLHISKAMEKKMRVVNFSVHV